MNVTKIVDVPKLIFFKQNTLHIHGRSSIFCGVSLSLFLGGRAPETKELTKRQTCSIQINRTPIADFKFE